MGTFNRISMQDLVKGIIKMFFVYDKELNTNFLSDKPNCRECNIENVTLEKIVNETKCIYIIYMKEYIKEYIKERT